MMGRGHAASGMAAGAAGVAWWLPAVGYQAPGGLWSTAVLSTVLAGACLFPDIDHERSTAANAFGPASRGVQAVVAVASVLFTDATGTKRDEPKEHRGLTHTLLFALAMYGAIVACGARWPRLTVAVVVALAVAVLVRLGARWTVSAPVGALAGFVLWTVSAHVPGPGPQLVGGAVAIGCALHCLGDAITRSGVPFLAPLVKIKGKRWWDLRPPLMFTFRAGGEFEQALVYGFFLITVLAGLDASNVIGLLQRLL